MRRLLALFVMIASLAHSDVVTIYNSGAEIGTTSGWTNTQNYFNAIYNPALAWEGNWFFEANYIFNGINPPGTFQKTIDLRQYFGLISDLNISISLAQEPGAAFDPVENKNYTYETIAVAYFLDYNLNRLDDGFVFAVNSSANWLNRGGSFGGPQWSQFIGPLGNIGGVWIMLQGAWSDSSNGSAGYGFPSNLITDVPVWTRYDDLKIEITLIPEPSSLSLLAIGFGALAMMRRRRS